MKRSPVVFLALGLSLLAVAWVSNPGGGSGGISVETDPVWTADKPAVTNDIADVEGYTNRAHRGYLDGANSTGRVVGAVIRLGPNPLAPQSNNWAALVAGQDSVGHRQAQVIGDHSWGTNLAVVLGSYASAMGPGDGVWGYLSATPGGGSNTYNIGRGTATENGGLHFRGRLLCYSNGVLYAGAIPGYDTNAWNQAALNAASATTRLPVVEGYTGRVATAEGDLNRLEGRTNTWNQAAVDASDATGRVAGVNVRLGTGASLPEAATWISQAIGPYSVAHKQAFVGGELAFGTNRAIVLGAEATCLSPSGGAIGYQSVVPKTMTSATWNLGTGSATSNAWFHWMGVPIWNGSGNVTDERIPGALTLDGSRPMTGALDYDGNDALGVRTGQFSRVRLWGNVGAAHHFGFDGSDGVGESLVAADDWGSLVRIVAGSFATGKTNGAGGVTCLGTVATGMAVSVVYDHASDVPSSAAVVDYAGRFLMVTNECIAYGTNRTVTTGGLQLLDLTTETSDPDNCINPSTDKITLAKGLVYFQGEAFFGGDATPANYCLLYVYRNGAAVVSVGAMAQTVADRYGVFGGWFANDSATNLWSIYGYQNSGGTEAMGMTDLRIRALVVK